ncbi:hypothetical protein [Streptomyces sp. NPDC086989]|uniref:hypothetical protein n=1 Tax=Streptomyces sp. NPDC086989 TaxID=3365764 RepID=UPI00382B9ADA
MVRGLRFLGSIRERHIIGLAARRYDTGLSPEVMAKVNAVVAELKRKLPEVQGE